MILSAGTHLLYTCTVVNINIVIIMMIIIIVMIIVRMMMILMMTMTSTRAWMASLPSSLSSPPMRTRSGHSRSCVSCVVCHYRHISHKWASFITIIT